MNYTIEEIYQLVGKEDKIAGITFKRSSESYNEYGEFITVVFLYTQKEREELDTLLENKPYSKHGYVKAKYLDRSLSSEKIEQLSKKGIFSEDITEILYFKEPTKNTFHSTEKKELYKINIPFNSDSKGGNYDWIYGFKKKQLEDGIGLSPSERALYLACKLYYEPEQISEEEKNEISFETGIDVKIEWELLQLKYLREEISEQEKKRLAELYGKKKKENIEILDRYLNQAGSSLKKLAKDNIEQATELFMKVMQFKERRLTIFGKYPIYLDLDSYLHIYMRHVEEFKVNNHFEHKDNFLWHEEDVFKVIGNVIKEIEAGYQDYRSNNLEKRYSRYGKDSHYFQGDYYTFHIEPNGRISTFHKNNKEHEKK